MSIQYFDGDLLESGCDFICHQVNCKGVMGSGIAKSIKDKWPVVYEEYRDWYISCDAWAHAHRNDECQYQPADVMLGNIQIINVNYKQKIVNMAGQNDFGYEGKRYTSYDAFWSCLGEIKKAIPEGSRIGFPYGIGCVRGGANWNIIETMIKEVLEDKYQVEIWRFDKG